MKSALLITVGADLRRFGLLLLAGTITYLIGAWPDILIKVVAAHPGAAAVMPVIYLTIEFAQKLIRESAKEKSLNM